jgi:hypothetical protein
VRATAAPGDTTAPVAASPRRSYQSSDQGVRKEKTVWLPLVTPPVTTVVVVVESTRSRTTLATSPRLNRAASQVNHGSPFCDQSPLPKG